MKLAAPKLSNAEEKEIGTLQCMCFVRRHHRTLSVPCIRIRTNRSLPNNCACNKWGTELTRKSYSHLSRLCKDEDLMKSMLTFECVSAEKQLLANSSPDRLREWWGFFLDPSEAETGLNEED